MQTPRTGAARTAILMGGRSATHATSRSASGRLNGAVTGGGSGRLNGLVAATLSESDRFIPQRGGASEQGLNSYQLKAAAAAADDSAVCPTTPTRRAGCGAAAEVTVSTSVKDDLKEVLADGLFDGKMEAKVLAYRQRAPVLEGAAAGSSTNPHSALHTFARAGPCGAGTGAKRHDGAGKRSSRVRTTRHIAPSPAMILDVPNFLADYYLNLLDWGATDIVALGLDTVVYLWNSATAEIVELVDTGEPANKIASVKWDKNGKYIAVGLFDGTVQLWDADARKKLRSLQHAAGIRVAALDWNEYLLVTGAKDGSVKLWDVRTQSALLDDVHDHDEEVCGIRWRDDGKQLATGGNDNRVIIYDFDIADASAGLDRKFELSGHQAAVKAVAWCPWQRDLLATGGGTNDRAIRFWNTTTGECRNEIDAGSQVSAIVWSKNPASKEFVTSHGFATNALVVWKYPSLVRVTELLSHEERVLHMAASPDGRMVVSASPEDESLRFWNIFEPTPALQAAGQKAAAKARQADTAASRRLGTTRIIR